MIAREMKIDNNATVNAWAKDLREVCVQSTIGRSEPIGGPGIIVEIDESKFESVSLFLNFYNSDVDIIMLF